VTYLWSRVLEKLYSTLSLVKKFPAFYGTWRFITMLTSACRSLCWARWIQFAPFNPIPLRSTVILSYHVQVWLGEITHLMLWRNKYELSHYKMCIIKTRAVQMGGASGALHRGPSLFCCDLRIFL
jgi:hypothetical protein